MSFTGIGFDVTSSGGSLGGLKNSFTLRTNVLLPGIFDLSAKQPGKMIVLIWNVWFNGLQMICLYVHQPLWEIPLVGYA